jgi:hypothetical protein
MHMMFCLDAARYIHIHLPRRAATDPIKKGSDLVTQRNTPAARLQALLARLFPREQLAALQPYLLPVVLVMLGFSLGLHAWTYLTIQRTRAVAHEQVAILAAEVQTLKTETLTTDVHIRQDVPIRMTVPVQRQFDVPVETSIPIDESVDMRAAGIDLRVPLSLNVPISTTVPVDIDEMVDVNTSIQLDVELPISVPISETNVIDYLDRLHRALVDLNQELESS